MHQDFTNYILSYFSDPLVAQVLQAIYETILMVIIPGSLAIVLGILIGFALYILRPDQSYFKKLPTDSSSNIYSYIYNILDFIINIGRSIPFIILMIAALPFTRFVVGKTIGTIAACVPLTLAAIPFMARIVENSCLNVSRGVIEAANSMGASTMQILWYVVLPESKINIINGAGLMLVTLVGYGSMAGTLAGGGLGALAFNYGYQRFNNKVILITVILILLVVQLLQCFTNYIVKHHSH